MSDSVDAVDWDALLENPSYLPPAREESSDGSECEDSPENESDKIQAVSVISKVTKKAQKNGRFFAQVVLEHREQLER